MSDINLDPTDLAFLEPEDVLRRALWAARYRDLPTQEAFDALLYAAYFTPVTPPDKLGQHRDGAMAMRLEQIQWDMLVPMAGLADQLLRGGQDIGGPGNLVPVWNKALAPHMGTLMRTASAGLSSLGEEAEHPVFDRLMRTDHEGEPDRSFVQAAEQLVLNAMARMSAYMRSGWLETFMTMSGRPPTKFDRQQFLQNIHQMVEPFVVIAPSHSRHMGDFDSPKDDGKPNLILEGWCATHFNDRTQVSVSFAQKEDRMRTLSATHFVIEQGGYPLKPGQALASHGMDLHVMPVV